MIWREAMSSERNFGEGAVGEVSCLYFVAERTFRAGMSYFSART